MSQKLLKQLNDSYMTPKCRHKEW